MTGSFDFFTGVITSAGFKGDTPDTIVVPPGEMVSLMNEKSLSSLLLGRLCMGETSEPDRFASTIVILFGVGGLQLLDSSIILLREREWVSSVPVSEDSARI
jgi:hypothetical protein